MSDVGGQDLTIRHGGRMVVLNVYVNSDEDIETVLERVKVAARGEPLHMAMMTGFVKEAGADATETWEHMIAAVRETYEKRRPR